MRGLKRWSKKPELVDKKQQKMLEREGILSQLVQCGDACCLTEETLCNCPLQMYTPNLDAAERRRETLHRAAKHPHGRR